MRRWAVSRIRFPEKLPKDIAKELMAISEAVLADYTGNPRVAAFWAPRLGPLCRMVCRDGSGPARGHDEDGARGRRQDGACRAGRAVHADGAGRPHRRRQWRARRSRTTRAAQSLQNLSKQGDGRRGAAASARSGHRGGQRFCQRAARTGDVAPLHLHVRRRAAGPGRSAGGGRRGGPRALGAGGIGAPDCRVRSRDDALSCRAPCPLQVQVRRICAPCARCGMAGGRTARRT